MVGGFFGPPILNSVKVYCISNIMKCHRNILLFYGVISMISICEISFGVVCTRCILSYILNLLQLYD